MSAFQVMESQSGIYIVDTPVTDEDILEKSAEILLKRAKTNKEVFIQFAPIRTQLIHNSMKFRIYLSKSPKTQGNFNEKLFSNGYNAELLNKRCTRCDTPLLGYGDDCNRCMKCNKLLVLWKMLSADRNKLPKELDIGGGIILTDRVLIRRHLDFAKVRLHNESEIKEGIAFKCESCKRHTKVEYLAKGSKNRCKRCVAHAIENKRIGEVGGGVLLARELAKQRQQTPQCELASKSESENNMIAKFLKDKSCQL